MKVYLYGGPKHGEVIDHQGASSYIRFVEPIDDFPYCHKPQQLTWLQKQAVDWLGIKVEQPIPRPTNVQREYKIERYQFAPFGDVFLGVYEQSDTPSVEDAFDFIWWADRKERRRSEREVRSE